VLPVRYSFITAPDQTHVALCHRRPAVITLPPSTHIRLLSTSYSRGGVVVVVCLLAAPRRSSFIDYSALLPAVQFFFLVRLLRVDLLNVSVPTSIACH